VTNIQQENTSTWVDQRYGSLLARLSSETLDASASELVRSLKSKGRMVGSGSHGLDALRTYVGWLAETPLKKVGYGVSRPGTRVWLLRGDTDNSHSGLLICSSDFNRHGRVTRPKSDSHALVTHHAMTRLFERLRTNALGEVIRIGLLPLTELPPPEELGDEATIRIPSVGRFEAVAGMDETSPDEMIWIIKTFIDD
jgi:hypothetical protein